MFALFFPAVTGIMAGANMSGDLRDPARAIPRGTLWAVAVTAVIYLAMAVLLAGSRSAAELIARPLVVADIAYWPIVITAGVFAATLSSAMGSMMGAPRILQAFARDNVFGTLRPFAAGSGKSNEPRRAIMLTFAISQATVLLADLNTIAPLITMFFMITYGLLIVSMALLHRLIGRKEVEARWGDVQSGLLFERTRQNLLRLENELYHPKNWRPIILALSGVGWERPHLAIYGHWFTTGHGILVLGQVIQGEVEDRLDRRLAQERILHDFIRQEKLEAFPAVVVAPYLSDGIDALVQCQGMGALRSNTVIIGWPVGPERAESFGATLRSIAGLRRSIIAVRFQPEPADPWSPFAGPIDVWWRGHQNGGLMLLLAYLLTKNPEWRNHRIRLMRVIENEAGVAEVERHLRKLADQARIITSVKAVVAADPKMAIQQMSRDAAIVLMGFEPPEEGDEQKFFERMQGWAGDLPRVVFVDSVGEMSLES
jgi:hypothetical protein